MPAFQGRLRQEVAICLQNLIDVLLNIFTKSRRNLVEATDQTVTEAGVGGAGLGVESGLLDVIVEVKAFSTTSDAPLSLVQSFDSQVEEVTLYLSVRRNRVESRKLDGLYTLLELLLNQLFVHSLLTQGLQ